MIQSYDFNTEKEVSDTAFMSRKSFYSTEFAPAYHAGAVHIA